MFKIYNAREQLWQWDVGQRLIVSEKIPCSEVHFCNGTSDCSLVCEIHEEDGLRLVDVPNILLQTTKTIKVFAYVCNGDDHHTRFSKYFTVTPRSKPADYVYTETEVKTFAKLEERMNTLEESVSAEGVAKAVEDYLTENPPQSGATVEEAEQIAQNKQNIKKLSEEKLDSSKLSESIKTALGYTPADAEGVSELSKAIADKLDKSGGTLNGKFVIPTADTKAGFVNSEDMKIFGYGTNNFRMGDPNKPLELRGSGTNPMFGSKKILVEGDITGGLLSVETITIGDGDSGETETIPVTGLSLDLTTYSAKAGDGFYINPVVLPTTATNKAVTWKSSATNTATVDGSGYVECVAEGDAVITCTTVDGGFTATCAVSVADENNGETEVTLFSISATYSGGEVAVGTAVSDLTGIVVTAHYSDGSTATVTDYTLSGVIAEGGNTITVNYGGKTTTFTVTGVAESTGGKVQFSTLEVTSGLLKADETVVSLGKTHHVSFPYTEGMFVSTGTNGGWGISTYPPVLVLDGGAYSAPPMTKADNAITVDGTIITQYSGTLTGYSADAVVYANILTTGTTDDTVKTNMDKAGIFYYIPGGEA